MPNRTLLFWGTILALFALILYATQPILLPFIVGMLIAYLLDPAADFLETKGLSRTLATLCIMCVFFALFVLALFWLIPAIAHQITALLADLPNVVQAVRAWLAPYIENITAQLEPVIGSFGETKGDAAQSGPMQETAKGLLGLASGLGKTLLSSTTALVNIMSLLFITPIVSFYLLRDWDRMVADIDALLPRTHAETIRQQCRAIDSVLAGFIRGTLNVSLVLAVFYIVTLSAVGLNYALLIGLIGGIAIIIPYLGTIISGLLAVGMAVAQFDSWESIALVAAIFTAGQMLEGNFLTPKLVGDKVGLHPVWIIFGMLAGGTLLGFVGILLAVPISATIGVLVRFGLQRYKESAYYGAKKS